MKKNILHNKSIEEFHTDLLSGKICLNSTCNLWRAYFAIKQINSISIVQKTIAKYHGNFAIKIQGPAKCTSNIQVNVSHRYIKWIILL